MHSWLLERQLLLYMDKQTTEKRAGEARCFVCFLSTEGKKAILASSELETVTEEKNDPCNIFKKRQFLPP